MTIAQNHHLAPPNNSEKFMAILRDLKQLLEREKTHLQSGSVDRLGSFAREKMQMFVNLNHLAQTTRVEDQIEENRVEVIDVNKMLKQNLNVLKFRMDAISEITKTIEDAITESESDGTYDASGFAKG